MSESKPKGHEILETNIFWMVVLILVVISFGGSAIKRRKSAW